jgi:hypothetical protein
MTLYGKAIGVREFTTISPAATHLIGAMLDLEGSATDHRNAVRISATILGLKFLRRIPA